MKRQSKPRVRPASASAPQPAIPIEAIPVASCLIPLILRNQIMAGEWEQRGYRDYQDFVTRNQVPENLAIKGMSMALQHICFTNKGREQFGQEKINQLNQVLSYELEGLTLAQLMIKVADIFGVGRDE